MSERTYKIWIYDREKREWGRKDSTVWPPLRNVCNMGEEIDQQRIWNWYWRIYKYVVVFLATIGATASILLIINRVPLW